MTGYYLALALFLLLNPIAGLARVRRGPTAADRMLAAMLFGTTGVAILITLAEALQQPVLRDGALVFSVLAAVNAIAFVRSRWRAEDGGRRRGRGVTVEAGDLVLLFEWAGRRLRRFADAGGRGRRGAGAGASGGGRLPADGGRQALARLERRLARLGVAGVALPALLGALLGVLAWER